MSDSHQTVLITGANGFIGSRLCSFFHEQGFEVIAGVRKGADLTLLEADKVSFRYGDVTDRNTLPEMVTGVDYVVHNAGVIKAQSRDHFFAVNEQGTKLLFEEIINHNPDVKKVVLISSLAVAGPSNGNPVKESDKPNPITTYGESKAAGERVALSFSGRLPVVAVRPPAVYGPGDRALYSLFMIVFRHLRPLIGDSSRKLQIVHVDDLCRGIFLATTQPTNSGSVYFIAENKAYSAKELMNTFKTASGRWSIPLPIPAPLFKAIATVSSFIFRAVGVTPLLTREKTRELLASWEISTELAEKEIGYVSKISLLEGSRQTYKWYQDKGWL